MCLWVRVAPLIDDLATTTLVFRNFHLQFLGYGNPETVGVQKISKSFREYAYNQAPHSFWATVNSPACSRRYPDASWKSSAYSRSIRGRSHAFCRSTLTPLGRAITVVPVPASLARSFSSSQPNEQWLDTISETKCMETRKTECTTISVLLITSPPFDTERDANCGNSRLRCFMADVPHRYRGAWRCKCLQACKKRGRTVNNENDSSLL